MQVQRLRPGGEAHDETYYLPSSISIHRRAPPPRRPAAQFLSWNTLFVCCLCNAVTLAMTVSRSARSSDGLGVHQREKYGPPAVPRSPTWRFCSMALLLSDGDQHDHALPAAGRPAGRGMMRNVGTRRCRLLLRWSGSSCSRRRRRRRPVERAVALWRDPALNL